MVLLLWIFLFCVCLYWLNILLTVSRRYFFCWSFMFFLSFVCYVFVCVCLYVLCGNLLGKGWPLGSRLWCLTVSLSISHWYPGSGVVLDCINSWALHPYLLLLYCLVCVMQPCGHLLGKGWLLGSLVYDVFLRICHFPIWYPGSSVLLDCIDSWSLPSSLL